MRIFTLLLLFVSFQFQSNAQKTRSIDTTKYRINLPEYWKPGNKVWRILNNNLPKVCLELANKDLCGDNCQAGYTVDFEVTEPIILDYYSNKISGNRHEIITLYTFQSNLFVRNKDGVITSHIILADTNEVFRLKNTAYINDVISPPTPPKFRLTKNQAGQPEMIMLDQRDPSLGSRLTGGESPYNYINKNKDKLGPTLTDLYRVIDQKIRSLE